MGQVCYKKKNKSPISSAIYPEKQKVIQSSQEEKLTSNYFNDSNTIIRTQQTLNHKRGDSISSRVTNDQSKFSNEQTVKIQAIEDEKMQTIREEPLFSQNGSISLKENQNVQYQIHSILKSINSNSSNQKIIKQFVSQQKVNVNQICQQRDNSINQDNDITLRRSSESEKDYAEDEDNQNYEDASYQENDQDEDEGEEVDYVVGQLIQEGTRVYSALNVVSGQLLAVKIFPLSEVQENLNDDVLIKLPELYHDNIHETICYHHDEDKNTLNIVMPFESGGSITWLLQKFNKFSPHLASLFLKQILEGLQYLNEENLTHQNLKTSNVLVDEGANAKLTDINIVNKYKLSLYSAPECFENAEYTIVSDVWSAGIIFYEMLTQKNPWLQDLSVVSLQDIHQKMKSGKLFKYQNLEYPDSVQTLITQILDSIFKINPNDRPTPSKLLSLDFFKFRGIFFKQNLKVFESNEQFKQSVNLMYSGLMLSQTNQPKKKKQRTLAHHKKQQDINSCTNSLVEQSLSSQRSSLKIREKNNHIPQKQIKQLMDRLNSLDDLYTSGDLSETPNNSLSLTALKQQVFHQKRVLNQQIKGVNQVIEEEDLEETGLAKKENPLIENGYIRKIQSTSSNKNNSKFAYKEDPKFTKQNKSSGASSSDNSQKISINPNSKKKSSKSSMENTQRAKIKNLTGQYLNKQSKSQVISSQQSQDPPMNQKELEQQMEMQFYMDSATNRTSSKIAGQSQISSEHLNPASFTQKNQAQLIQALMGQQSTKGQNEDEERIKLEEFMAEQFYSKSGVSQDSKSQPTSSVVRADKTKVDLLVHPQLDSIESNKTKNKKEVSSQNSTQRAQDKKAELQRLEDEIDKQFYSGYIKEQEEQTHRSHSNQNTDILHKDDNMDYSFSIKKRNSTEKKSSNLFMSGRFGSSTHKIISIEELEQEHQISINNDVPKNNNSDLDHIYTRKRQNKKRISKKKKSSNALDVLDNLITCHVDINNSIKIEGVSVSPSQFQDIQLSQQIKSHIQTQSETYKNIKQDEIKQEKSSVILGSAFLQVKINEELDQEFAAIEDNHLNEVIDWIF